MNNEDKQIVFYEDSEYTIICEGYDVGTMDISVTEFEGNEAIRQANFYDLAVTSESIHEVHTKTDPMDTVVYSVTSGNGDVITADYDSNIADDNNNPYTMTIQNGYFDNEDGLVFEVTAFAGQLLNISAIIPEGYVFCGWKVSAGSGYIADTSAVNTTVRIPDQDSVITAVIEKTSEPENPFTDVPEGSFYYEPVSWAVANGITNGTSATTFSPNDPCMRAHVVTFLWRAAGCPEPKSNYNPFVDVKESNFFYKAVLWAVENGITNGTSSTTFSPNMDCNRAQIVTFLYRAMKEPEYSVSNCVFTDVTDSTAFYYNAVLWAVENGITNGMGDNTFGVLDTCNRAQVVTFLYRAF